MAESTEKKHMTSWPRVASIALIVLGLAATTAIAATVTQTPTISGTLESGSELTASSGSWTPTSATPSYDWLRCDAAGLNCAGITGACGRTYKVRTADENHTLRVRLTVKNGNDASADSAQTAVIEPKPYLPNVGESDTCTQVKPTGPSQGTFSSGGQISAGSEPPPPEETSLDFIDPFPVIRVAGRFKGKRTTLKRVTVKAPNGTRIQARCKGKGCPWPRKAAWPSSSASARCRAPIARRPRSNSG